MSLYLIPIMFVQYFLRIMDVILLKQTSQTSAYWAKQVLSDHLAYPVGIGFTQWASVLPSGHQLYPVGMCVMPSR